MRTICQLSKMNGRVYVFLRDRIIQQKFLSDAENEGFTFCDGVKPTERSGSDVYTVNRDWTINFVGFIGHMAFRNPGNVIGKPMIRIDYEKYVLGFDDYIMEYSKNDLMISGVDENV